MKHTEEGKFFDKEKSKKIKGLFEARKEELTEYELVQVINKIIEGNKYFIDNGELQNLLMVIQEIKIRTLKDEESKNLADFIKANYQEPDIYRYLKFTIYNQVSRHNDDMKDIISRLGLPDKQYNFTLVNKESLKKYLDYFDQDFIKKFNLNKDLEGESESISPEDKAKIDGNIITNIGGTDVIQVAPGQGLTLGLGTDSDGGFVLTNENGKTLPEPDETHIVGIGDIKQDKVIDVIESQDYKNLKNEIWKNMYLQ